MARYAASTSRRRSGIPSVAEAERLGDPPVGEGTEFRVVADFLGRKAALTYRIIEVEPGEAVTLPGENATVISLDRLELLPHAWSS